MALPLTAPTVLIKSHQDLYQATTDELGRLQAQLAPLLNKQEALKQILRESGLDVVEGDAYRATISAGQATTVIDWEGALRAICSEERLARLVDQFATVRKPGSPRVSVKARKGV